MSDWIAFLQNTISSTCYSIEPTLGNNCILVVKGKEVARCESPPLKRLTEQSSLKCIGGSLEHAQKGSEEEYRDRKKIGEQLVNVADYLCFSQGIRTLFILHFQVTVAANNFTST